MVITITGQEVHSMSLENCKPSRQPSPPSIQEIQDQIHSTCDDIMHFCMQSTEVTFYPIGLYREYVWKPVTGCKMLKNNALQALSLA